MNSLFLSRCESLEKKVSGIVGIVGIAERDSANIELYLISKIKP
jgi:hypothetical protein